MTDRHDIVFIGLSLSSSWGNGHATTYRALLRGLRACDREVLFLERDVPWYAAHRDMPAPPFCDFALYTSLHDLWDRFGPVIAQAGAVIVGSYVPEGVALIDALRGRAGGPVGFYDIDTPITLAALRDGDCAYLARRQVPVFDVYFSFAGGPVLETLRQEFGARAAQPLYCAVDADAYRPVATPRRWELGYLGTYSADRQPALERLLIEPARRLPDKRFVVAGPQFPATIDWPRNVERIEHLPPASHPEFYSAQRFTLNVTRARMVATGWSPSVRLFEAAACGVPIVSDRWEGLSALLPNAVVIADDADTVVSLLQETSETMRNTVAAAANAIVLANHTGQARARELINHLSNV